MPENAQGPLNWEMSPEQFVNTLYHVLLGRSPDVAGFHSHVTQLRETRDPTRTLKSFLGSPEYRRRQGLLLGNDACFHEATRSEPNLGVDFNDVLHDIRTKELQNTEGTSGTMVSIGCNSAPYFDWIHQHLGKPNLHIGLENYLQKPENLPENVRWISNSAGEMKDLSNRSVDLIFAGQVVEHLWADELINFFHECCRVLKPGGRLIFDTPNERITRRTGWNHGEHTLEFRPKDAQILLKGLGFEVIKLVGHWLVEGEDGFLRLNDTSEEEPYSKSRRIDGGRDRPESCFNWWVEACYQGDVVPDKIATCNLVRGMWHRYGHYIYNRTTNSDAEFAYQRYPGPNGRIARVEPGWSGRLLHSTDNAFPPGKIEVSVEIGPYQGSKSPGFLEITQPSTGVIFGRRALPSNFEGGKFEVEANIPATVFSGSFNLFVEAQARMEAHMAFFVQASVYPGEIWDLRHDGRIVD